MVKNIGVEGTHSNKYYQTLFLEYGEIDVDNLIYPKKIERNYDFDLKLHKKYNFKNYIILKLRKLILNLLNFSN